MNSKSSLLLATIAISLLMASGVIWNSQTPTVEITDAHQQLPTFQITPEPWPLQADNLADISHIQAKSAILINEDTGQIIAERDMDSRLPMASTTKIMTAALALEFTEPSSLVTIPDQALDGLPPDSALMGISPGEKYTVEELLYGLMLNSGNDAANAIALSISGSQNEFVNLMNAKAHQLGLKDTHFSNPSGLDHDDHYSTARELAIITHYARSFPVFNQIVATPTKILPYSSHHKYLELTNLNSLISMYPGATGTKPGNTGNAGNCLVASVEREGQRYIGVLLNTPGRNANMSALFDVAFQP